MGDSAMTTEISAYHLALTMAAVLWSSGKPGISAGNAAVDSFVASDSESTLSGNNAVLLTGRVGTEGRTRKLPELPPLLFHRECKGIASVSQVVTWQPYLVATGK